MTILELITELKGTHARLMRLADRTAEEGFPRIADKLWIDAERALMAAKILEGEF